MKISAQGNEQVWAKCTPLTITCLMVVFCFSTATTAHGQGFLTAGAAAVGRVISGTDQFSDLNRYRAAQAMQDQVRQINQESWQMGQAVAHLSQSTPTVAAHPVPERLVVRVPEKLSVARSPERVAVLRTREK